MDPAGIVLDLSNNTAFVADQGAHAIYLIDMEYHTNEVIISVSSGAISSDYRHATGTPLRHALRPLHPTTAPPRNRSIPSPYPNTRRTKT